ncbi:hypothetical protein IW261DRAFT_1456698 [Armillaria novae-zelandiae]|uniref:Uncharacterized protein n=1 Tax=Armillaria novae-zelandiae TaxID=153914 RepID=A0AA39UF12_9AGAR|nr:hypothetical protein IW261DRAFT_1456698 [Armillaria novae-zelandiae]
MANSPSHSSTHSMSSSNLQLPSITDQKRQRRMTSPSTMSLTLPEKSPSQSSSGRPPSPLRNEFIPNTFTGIDAESEDGDEDDDGEDEQWMRSPSPTSSVSQFAASWANRVGNLVSGIAPRSPSNMPTDAEIEAEAERERERGRREAERILTEEAAGRKMVEDRVLAMLESTRSLPPPPSRSQTMPASNPPSPSASQKESMGWWTAAKNRLTPTKELTPAQQVIQDTKAREKEQKRNSKGKEREREKSWPANTQTKYSDPAYLNLSAPTTPPRRPIPVSSPNVSPTPSRPNATIMPPNLTPSPMRHTDSGSSSREAPPLYAQFDSEGTLDVHVTLLTIAKRFEKLEKWTVGHVRALEERMSDVERWLVDKEKEKDESSVHEPPAPTPNCDKEIQDLRDEMTEIQSRVGELGREMAKLATAPANLSSVPSRQSAEISIAPQTTSSMVVQGNSYPTPVMNTPNHGRYPSGTVIQTSPPLGSSKTSVSRLPYPTGDYASPPPSTVTSFSPPHSPPSASRTRPLSISGLPPVGVGLGISTAATASHSSSPSPSPSAYSSAFSSAQPASRSSSPASKNLPPPPGSRRPSYSPTPAPRKRYTVALGEPITSPPEEEERPERPPSSASSSIGRAYFSSSPKAVSDEEDFQEETIGKSSASKILGGSSSAPASPPNADRRIRAQSTYGFSSLQPPQASISPLKPKLRSRSSERSTAPPVPATGKFVDPYVLRQQSMNASKIATPKPVGKVPIGLLVAFFDGEKK